MRGKLSSLTVNSFINGKKLLLAVNSFINIINHKCFS